MRKKDGESYKKHTFQVDPQVVSIENLKLADGLEVFSVFRRNLSNFEKTD